MAGFDNIKGKGNRFSSTNQPENRGRKPSLYKHIKTLIGTDAEVELSREDFFKLIQFLLEQPADNLKKIAESRNTPIWIIGMIQAIIKDTRDGRTNTINSLFDRLFGKASQPITGKEEGPIELHGSVNIREWVKDRLQRK